MQETPHTPQPRRTEYEKFVQQIVAAMLCESGPFQIQLDQLRELYQPANVQEEFYLTQLAQSQLNVHRVGQLQAGLYTQFVQQGLAGEFAEAEAFPEAIRDENPAYREQRLNLVLADSFTKYALKGKVLGFFCRFYNEAKRNLRRDQEMFDRIRKQHLKPPSRPEPEKPEDPPKNEKTKVRILSKTGKPVPARKRSISQANLPSTVTHVLRRFKVCGGKKLRYAGESHKTPCWGRTTVSQAKRADTAVRPLSTRSPHQSTNTNNFPQRGSRTRAGPKRTRSPACACW